MSLQPHEIAFNKKEREEINNEIAWQAYKMDAVGQLTEEIEKNGDVLSLMEELSEGYDQFNILTNSEINEIMLDAYKKYLEVLSENN